MVTFFPLARLTGSITSLGWAFLHSTYNTELINFIIIIIIIIIINNSSSISIIIINLI